jgi:hypothetical protein
MNNTAWQNGREAAAKSYGEAFGKPAPSGFTNVSAWPQTHVWPQAAICWCAARNKVLLGHKNGDITSHYSAPEIGELIDAANNVCGTDSRNSRTGNSEKKNRLVKITHRRLILHKKLGAPAGFEPTTPWFVADWLILYFFF